MLVAVSDTVYLCTHLELAFAIWIGEHKFCCRHPVACIGFRPEFAVLNETLFRSGIGFAYMVVDNVNVPVNIYVAHLSVVVGVRCKAVLAVQLAC